MPWLMLLGWAASKAAHDPITGAAVSLTVYTASGQSLEVATGATKRITVTVQNG
jgi:hypothetical protein